MLRPTAVKVVPMNDYLLSIEFDNGEQKVFDVKPYIQGSWYGELSDPAYFKSVVTNGYSVEAKTGGSSLCSLTQKQTRLYHFFFGDPAWF